MSETVLEHTVKQHHRDVCAIANLLHEWHCHRGHAPDAQCHPDACTWPSETWEKMAEVDQAESSRKRYYDKADRMWQFFGNTEEVRKNLNFLQSVNPRLCWTLIEEL